MLVSVRKAFLTDSLVRHEVNIEQEIDDIALHYLVPSQSYINPPPVIVHRAYKINN